MYRRRRVVALAWVAVLLVGFGVGGRVFGRLGTGSGLSSRSESVVVDDLLASASRAGPEVVALVDGRSTDDPGLRASVTAAALDLAAVPGVGRVLDAWSSHAPGLRSRDGRATLVRVELRGDLDGAAFDQARDAVSQRLRRIQAPRVVVGGDALARGEFQERARKDLERGEALAIPVMLVLLLLIFRGFLAASVPLAVDYSLLVISRFREERAGGREVPAAIERTLATAGRTVAFSGLTVAASLVGLLLFAEPFLHSMAWSGIGVVLTALLAAITLVPALLGMWGRRIRPTGGAARPDRGVFYRLSRVVQRGAAAIVPLLAVGLLLLAVPFRHSQLENSGREALPRSSPSRRLYDATRSRFPGGGTDPIVAVAEADPRAPLFAGWVERVRALPGVQSVTRRPGTAPTVVVLDIVPAGSSQGPVATGLVERIRGLERPTAVGVTGSAAFLVDYRASLLARLPLVLALIGAATFALLFLMTGSVVVPLKAIVMNVLSLGASFGALVWVFQEGHLSRLLAFDPPGMVDITVPVLIFVFAFGLSMDYEVFLLSRIKEAWDQTGDNDRAVALGLQRTGRIVTSAATLIVVVFLGFAAGQLLTIKEVGIGMAIAVVLDATVVRMLLVPAAMKLLGRWNWWAPAGLRRLHARAGLAERAPAPAPAAPAEPAGTDRAPVH